MDAIREATSRVQVPTERRNWLGANDEDTAQLVRTARAAAIGAGVLGGIAAVGFGALGAASVEKGASLAARAGHGLLGGAYGGTVLGATGALVGMVFTFPTSAK